MLTFLLFYYVLDAWSRSALAPLVVSYLKFTDRSGACRLSFERVLDAIISRSSKSLVAQQSTLCLFSRRLLAFTQRECRLRNHFVT